MKLMTTLNIYAVAVSDRIRENQLHEWSFQKWKWSVDKIEKLYITAEQNPSAGNQVL